MDKFSLSKTSMMHLKIGVLLIFCGLCLFPAISLATDIAELEFKGSRIIDVIRVLSEDSNVNIIATPAAGKKEVTLFLKNVSLEQAIKSICRISDLWYRRDKGQNGMFRLMTTEEYAKDLVVGQDDAIKVFQLHTPNVIAIASAIEDLYGDRVEVSFGNGAQLGGAGGNNENRQQNSSGRSRRSGGGRSNGRGNNRSRGKSSGNNTIEQERLPDDLTADQFETLAMVNKQIDSRQLAAVTGVKKIIHVTINAEHNLLIVKTSNQDVLKSIATLVDNLDRPQSQVMLEMKIVDIKVGEDFNALFNLEIQGGDATGDSLNPIIIGGAALTGGGSVVYEYLSKSIKANIELLEQNNRLRIVSNPMIVASNHRPASLFVGEERVMVRGYSIDSIDTLNTSRTITTPETEIKEIGTTLEVIPHINSDGTIHIILKQENSTLNEGAAIIPISNNEGGISNLPIDTITTAKLEGEVFAKHGYTVAVGGLIRDSFSRTRRKVPFVADMPLFGDLFRSTSDTDEQSEMVLLITPYILNHGNKDAPFDPTNKYHKYAPDLAMHSRAIAKNKPDALMQCREYCSPKNLTKTDL